MSAGATPPRVVSRAQIESVMGDVDVLAAMEEAFVAYSSGLSVVPPVGELLFEDPPGDAHIKYGYIKGDDIFVIKVATGFYDNPKTGLAPNSGLMLAFDAATGFISAVLLDEGHLTNVRTAAAGAVAARHLMPTTVDAIGVLGTGLQARMQVEALAKVTPVRRVVVWGRRRDAAELCAADLRAVGFDADVADTPRDVAARANLIVTATASHVPLLAAGDVRPGTHITAMGSDTETKQELDTALVARADRLVADSLSQCRERGEISHALRRGAIAPDGPVELGDVIRGCAPGRLRAQDITIADLTGVAVQDIAITKAILSLL